VLNALPAIRALRRYGLSVVCEVGFSGKIRFDVKKRRSERFGRLVVARGPWDGFITAPDPRERYCVTNVPELRNVATVAPEPLAGAVMGSTATAATPARRIPSSSAARGERSIINRRVQGPRSLILTITERRLSRFVTLA
jgi:hypothetical protein